MSAKNRRQLLRLVHLIAAVPLLFYIYAPDSATDQLGWLIKIVVIPLAALSGIVMWQLPRWTRARRRATTDGQLRL